MEGWALTLIGYGLVTLGVVFASRGRPVLALLTLVAGLALAATGLRLLQAVSRYLWW